MLHNPNHECKNDDEGSAVIIPFVISSGDGSASGTGSAHAKSADSVGVIVIDPDDHMGRARQMRRALYPSLRFWRGDYLEHESGVYRIIEPEAMSSGAYTWLDRTFVKMAGSDLLVPFRPGKELVAQTLAALQAVSHVDGREGMPRWLDGRTDPPPGDIVAFPNGLLNVRTGEFMPPNPLRERREAPAPTAVPAALPSEAMT